MEIFELFYLWRDLRTIQNIVTICSLPDNYFLVFEVNLNNSSSPPRPLCLRFFISPRSKSPRKHPKFIISDKWKSWRQGGVKKWVHRLVRFLEIIDVFYMFFVHESLSGKPGFIFLIFFETQYFPFFWPVSIREPFSKKYEILMFFRKKNNSDRWILERFACFNKNIFLKKSCVLLVKACF